MKKILYWFRQDLRLVDNPALYEATKAGEVIPIYILDNKNTGEFAMGSASRWWLHHSLAALNDSLQNKLHFYEGNPIDIIIQLTKQYSVNAVYWNRCYEPWQIKRDKIIKHQLQEQAIEVNSFNGLLLWEPWEVLKEDDSSYKVFTPYYRKCYTDSPVPRRPLAAPKNIRFCNIGNLSNLSTLDDLKLTANTKWANKFNDIWKIGEQAALNQFEQFKADGLSNYRLGRNFPAQQNVSRLSPHLHFGEISPNYVWYNIYDGNKSIMDDNIDTFHSELGWREFSYYLLFHNPDMPFTNLRSSFDRFSWIKDQKNLQKWQKGLTGIPIIDAGMRELWQTGYMHNRVRMIVASFLVKNLLIDWKDGESWFWDCLVDADLASNTASWQWVAGSGCDAAPFFRIFNPVTQGQKFDPEGIYTKKFVPELQKLPTQYLFNPWEAPSYQLNQAGVKLGETYPRPIIDLQKSRIRALEAYKNINTK